MKEITPFSGFTPEAGQFLLELKFNNDRSWFKPRKEVFDRVVNEPFKALARETTEELQEQFPEKEFDLHVSRIYRDARRLYGRGPYKEALWFSLKTWNGAMRGPGFWFEFNPVEYSFGMGTWDASAEQMEQWRVSIEANPAAFERILEKLEQHPELEIAGPMYKRQKKDMGKRLNPWYNQRQVQVICTKEFGGDILTPDFPRILAEEYAVLMPLYDYLLAHCPPVPYRNH